MEHWFEEDDRTFVHPTDPNHRVDIRRSSRHVRIELDREVVAESSNPTLLFETGFPTRLYLPMADVRMEMLETTDLSTSCPYKGDARYWDVVTSTARHRSVAWSYPFPISESAALAGLVCFYDEQVDVFVDGAPRSL